MAGVNAKVLFDYTAEQEDELSFNVGDTISNVKQDDGGWWEGELNGKRGVFPENFVAIIKAGEIKEELKKTFLADVKFNYDPEQEDELALEVGMVVEVTDTPDEGWWKGICNGKTGMFPSNFVEAKDTSKLAGPPHKPIPMPFTDTETNMLPEPLEPEALQANPSKIGGMFGMIKPGDLSRNKLKKVPSRNGSDMYEQPPSEVSNNLQADLLKPTQMVPPMHVDRGNEPEKKVLKSPTASTGAAAMSGKPQKAKAIFDYEPDQEDELKLTVGDVITIIDKDLFDGWMKGEVNGVRGIFPDNFVQILPLEDTGQAVVESPIPPAKEDPKPPPHGIGMAMFPPGGSPLQTELARKLAQKSSPPPVPAAVKKTPPPLPGAKPPPLPGSKPKAPLPPAHNKPVKPPAPNTSPKTQAKHDAKPALPLLPKNNTKLMKEESKQPLVNNLKSPKIQEFKSPFRPPLLLDTDAKLPTPVLASNNNRPPAPALSKNHNRSPLPPDTDNKLPTPSPTEETKPEVNISKIENPKNSLHEDAKSVCKKEIEDLEPVALTKCSSTSSASQSPHVSQGSWKQRSQTHSGSDAVKDAASAALASTALASTASKNINEGTKSADEQGDGKVPDNNTPTKLHASRSLQLNDVLATEQLTHMQRAKQPSKTPPSKYKDTKHTFLPEAPTNSNTVDNNSARDVIELRSQVTELQTKMSEMEIKFKKLMDQVSQELDTERKLRLSQQVDIDRLQKKLDILS